jgi:adenine deaminase
MNVKGNIVDILNKRILKGEVEVEKGRIKEIRESDHACENYI